MQGGEPHLITDEVDFYQRYQENHEGEVWTVLAKPGARNLEVPGSLSPHHVLVVNEGADNKDERPLRIDGSGISFEEGVPGHVQSALRRLHQNLGHPRGVDLVRHLRLAGCESAVIKAAKGMRCQVCESSKDPQVARPATLPRMLSFGEIVAADILYAHDCDDKRHTFLSLVDVGTTYQVVVKLANTGGKEIEKAFNTYWLTPFGAPNAVSLDLETGLQDGFSRLCSWHNVKIRNSATQAHFQSGVGERQGKWWKNIWARVCKELSITADEAQLAATAASSAKNCLRRRCGHSPYAWVFGREGRAIEDVLDPDSGGRVSFDVSDDARFQRMAAIRASARVAFHRSENDSKLRKALLQRARATTRPFENGEQVHYWHLPKNRRQGRWIGPGKEGQNYWVARGGRRRLTAPEHLRASGPEETGEFLAMNGVQRELEQLLSQDFDGDEPYGDLDDDGGDGLDDVGSLYSPSENEAENKDIEIDGEGEIDKDGEGIFVDDDDGDLRLLPDQPGDDPPEEDGGKRGWPSSRMKRKTPPEDVEWMQADNHLTYSIMLMKKHLTRRGLEKRQEKELRWSEIPVEFQQKFRDAEGKQWEEHLHFDALRLLDDIETEYVKKNVSPRRVLRSRWAYKDKNWSRRRQQGQAEWKCKSRLVIAGHTDPDIASGRLATDAPTLSRPGLLCLLQLLANGLHLPDPWRVSAGDIQCAFVTGSYLSREEELYIHQPATGFPGMKPGQLVQVKKNIFGLATSPREWWLDLQDGISKIEIEVDGATHRFDQCPLDPCIFVLRQFVNGGFVGRPRGYIGTHVDDLLVIAPTSTSRLIEKALGHAFPVGEWESELFNYLGSEIYYGDEEVVLCQQAYAESRLFTLDIPRVPRGANDEDVAGPGLIADNRSLVGALSWLSAQSRPDLTCSVSMAQQVQKEPTLANLKFTNLISKKAYQHREEGLRFRAIEKSELVVLVYHDAGWANAKDAKDTEHDEEGFELTEEDKRAGLQHEGPFVDRGARKAKKSNSRVASQLGELIVFAEKKVVMGAPGNFSVLDWKSKAGQRVCRSTFSAETQASVEGMEAGQHVRALFETLVTGELVKVEDSTIPLLCLSDCRSLYDHVHKQGVPRVPTDRRLAVDLAALRQALRSEQWSSRLPLAWLPSSFQLADVLTKPQDATKWWEFFRSKLLVPINLSEDVRTSIKLVGDGKTSVKPKDSQGFVPAIGEFYLEE